MISSLHTGVDLIECERVRRAIERHGERFLNRIFTPTELEQFGGNLTSLAVRYAAKEAVAKTLSTGIGDVSWQEIEVLRGVRKEPLLLLHGAAKALADKHGLQTWSLSLSHTREHAVAFVVAMGKE